MSVTKGFVEELITKHRRFQSTLLNFPNGEAGKGTSRILMQSTWTQHEKSLGIKVENACLGHPSANASIYFCRAAMEFWGNSLQEVRIHVKQTLNQEVANDEKQKQEDLELKIKRHQSQLNAIFAEETQLAEEILADAFNDFFQVQQFNKLKFEIKPGNIIPTIGGTGAIDAVFNCIQGWFLTGVPDYVLYPKDRILPVELAEGDEALTADSIERVMKAAEKENHQIGALLICNPNNPLGYILTREKWKAIINLIANQKFYLVVDEAYTGLGDFSKQPSPTFLQFLLSELNTLEISSEDNKKDNVTLANIKAEIEKYQNILSRTILMQTGTKTLSVSGERTGALVVFNSALRNILREYVEHTAPPSRSLKMAYAIASKCISSPKNWMELCFLKEYYKCQVEYVAKNLQEIGLGLSKTYSPQGTFYVIGNFKFFIGYRIRQQELLAKLKFLGLELKDDRIGTDLEIAYLLLFKHHISIPALSYFSGNPYNGHLRITCSGGKAFLDEILRKIKDAKDIVEKEKSLSPTQTFKVKSGFTPPSPEAAKKAELLRTSKNITHNISPKMENREWQPLPLCTTLLPKVTAIGTSLAEKESSETRHINSPFRKLRLLNLVKLSRLVVGATSGQLKTLPNPMASNTSLVLGNSRNNVSFTAYVKCSEVFCEYMHVYWEEKYTKSKKVQSIKANIFKNLTATDYHKACKDSSEITRIAEKTKGLREFSIIEQIVKENAAIDYGAIDGDAENIELMAESVRYFLDTTYITKENIVFYGGNTVRLLTSIFSKKLVSLADVKGNYVMLHQCSAVIINYSDLKNYSSEQSSALGKALSQQDVYLIFENFMQNFIGTNSAEVPMLEIIRHVSKEKLIFFQSSNIFTATNENVSFIVTADESLKSALIARITNFQVHAPRSLQFGLSMAVYELMILSKKEKETKLTAENPGLNSNKHNAVTNPREVEMPTSKGLSVFIDHTVEEIHSIDLNGITAANTPSTPSSGRLHTVESASDLSSFDTSSPSPISSDSTPPIGTPGITAADPTVARSEPTTPIKLSMKHKQQSETVNLSNATRAVLHGIKKPSITPPPIHHLGTTVPPSIAEPSGRIQMVCESLNPIDQGNKLLNLEKIWDDLYRESAEPLFKRGAILWSNRYIAQNPAVNRMQISPAPPSSVLKLQVPSAAASEIATAQNRSNLATTKQASHSEMLPGKLPKAPQSPPSVSQLPPRPTGRPTAVLYEMAASVHPGNKKLGHSR